MAKVTMLPRPLAAIPELALIGTAEFEAAHAGLVDHDHGSCLEIVAFDRGRHSYTAAGRAFHLTGGDFFYTPPHMVHSSGGQPQDKARHAWIQIDLSRPARGRRFLDSADGEKLRRRLARLPLLQGRQQPPLYPQLLTIFTTTRELCSAPAAPSPGARRDRLEVLDLRTRVLRFLLDFLAAAERAGAAQTADPTDAPHPPPSPAIAQAIAYMHANLPAPLAVRHIAQACGYTASAFKQAFRRETGLSPADYFLRLKIDEAKRRLSATDCPVTTLAIDLGFGSGQYFATAFRRLTTLTPSAWRKRHGPPAKRV